MKSLTKKHYKILGISWLGSALEFYDFVIFVYFANTISALFFSPDMPDWLRLLQTYGLFAVGYVFRPIGGLVLGHFGDILGRKKIFVVSIFLMAVPTFAIGCMPTYSQIGIFAPILLLLCRIMQGMAIGAEIPGASVFLAEHFPKRYIGFVCSFLKIGLQIGPVIGNLVSIYFNSHFTQDEILVGAWRYPFILGGIFGVVIYFLRKYLYETPVFQRMNKKTSRKDIPFKKLLLFHKSSMFLSTLLTCASSATYITMFLLTPSLIQKFYKVPTDLALQSNFFTIAFAAIGFFLSGILSIRFNAIKIYAIGCLGVGLSSILFYYQIQISYDNIIFYYSLNGFFFGFSGLYTPIIIKLFPPEVRFSGLAFSYNISFAIFGGLTPIFIISIIQYSLMGPAYYVAGFSFLGFVLSLYLLRYKKIIIKN
jgi:MFS family permease